MILVDSSVWIDVLADRDTSQSRRFNELLSDRQIIGIGDLVATEILQGIRTDREFAETVATLQTFAAVPIIDDRSPVIAANHYRYLRGRGITIRKTIDTLIATRCILDGFPLLYSDRDFDPFVQHCGLKSAMDLIPE